jgi:uncharacterized membrane protein YedE/YeeE
MGALIQLGSGCLFGIALSRSGAADFDKMVKMFRFEEIHLFALAGTTTAIAALGLSLVLGSRWGNGIRALPRAVHRGSVVGGMLFGAGWGLSGTCPGTALAQLGTGHVIALFTTGGILLGNWLFERLDLSRFGISRDSCN